MRLAGVCVLALLVAALRYQSDLPNLDDPGLLAHYNDRGWVELEGVVDGYPDVRDTWTNLKVEAESIEVEGERHQVRGTVLVRAPRFPAHSYGDRLRISGLLETPPEFDDFSYREYLARKGIYSFVNYPQIVKTRIGPGESLLDGPLFRQRPGSRRAGPARARPARHLCCRASCLASGPASPMTFMMTITPPAPAT